jgi:hypothetical protein
MFKIPDLYTIFKEYNISPFDPIDDKSTAVKLARESGLINSQEFNEAQGILELMKLNGA